MQVVEINITCLESGKGLLYSFVDVLGRAIKGMIGNEAELGGKEDLFTAACLSEPLPEREFSCEADD